MAELAYLPAQAGAKVFMIYVYMLKSIQNNWYYIGQTCNLEKRLEAHNNLKTRSTKHKAPFRIIYSKAFTDRRTARDYEKFLKIRSNKERLIKVIG